MRVVFSCAVLLASAPALAQSFDAHGLVLTPDDGDLADFMTTWRAESQSPGSLGISGLFEYAESPFVQYRSSGGDTPVREPLLDNVIAVNISAHAAFHERLGLALTGPIYLASEGLQGTQGASVGDFRVSAPVGILLAPEDGGFAVSAIPFATLPFGAAERFQGDGGLGGGALLAAGWRGGAVDVSYNLGIEAGPSPELYNLTGGSQLLTGLGTSLALTDTLGLRGEFMFRAGLTPNSIPGAGSPGEVIFSARGVPDTVGGFSWTAGAAAGVTPGASAASYRLFAGVGYAIGKVRDMDGDGISDSVDSCPEQRETRNDYEDLDGCPDALADLRVVVRHPEGGPMAGVPVLIDDQEVGRTNELGELVLEGRMPGDSVSLALEPSERTGVAEHFQGSITLEEGQTDVDVDLVWLPGAVRVVTRTDQGEIVDARVSFMGPSTVAERDLGEDGEEVFVLAPGDWRLLIRAESFGTERKDLTIAPNQLSLVVVEVVMAPAIVQLTTEEVVILEQVQFDLDKDTIRPESEALLNEVANNLLANPEIVRVEVQGHTDSQGRDGYNLDLSQRRVDSVLEFLKRAGLADERIVSVGYGEACPLADNRTEEGRAINRRVQFIIVEPMPAEGVPCHDGTPARRAESITIERTIEVEQKD